MTWLTAFAITQAVEVPGYLFAGRRLEPGRRWLLALGASAATHPVVWFAFPWQTASWEFCFLGAETFAVVVEGALGLIAGIRNPWLWSLVANGASVCVGIAVQELGR